VGLGAGAHSHRSELRYCRVSDPITYIKRLADGEDIIEMEEHLTGQQVLMEQVMLGLRMSEGLDLTQVEAGGAAGGEDLAAALRYLQQAGYLIKNGNNLRLSEKGVAVCDTIVDAVATSLCTVPLVSNKA
jgi:coproporphyrinogen III oxidase-like Fe-S oxidoreductase